MLLKGFIDRFKKYEQKNFLIFIDDVKIKRLLITGHNLVDINIMLLFTTNVHRHSVLLAIKHIFHFLIKKKYKKLYEIV